MIGSAPFIFYTECMLNIIRIKVIQGFTTNITEVMVLTLDGNLEHIAHEIRKTGIFFNVLDFRLLSM